MKHKIETKPFISYEEAQALTQCLPEFSSFKEILAHHKPLLQFLYHEKCRFPGQIPEKRVIVQPGIQHEVGGYYVNTEMPMDEYYPGVFIPFTIKGVWLPLTEGQLFTYFENIGQCPLVKKDKDGQLLILFLIHPKSESLYQKLLDDHPDQVITCEAMSLSSFRSLLVALPNETGGFQVAMVKVSLNVEVQGVTRLLSFRECALSVANSKILSANIDNAHERDIEFTLNVIEDPLAFIPNGFSSGMIYRELPDCLNPKKENREGSYLMPLLSLYGVKNRDILQQLIQAHRGNASQFLTDRILTPLAHSYITLLFFHETSIEAHGQNLLLRLNQTHEVTGLFYRDMGGVNLSLIKSYSLLPKNLQNLNLDYFSTHTEDAAKTLEDHVVRRGLYPLTKQLVKNVSFADDDPELLQWRTLCESNGFLKNWTLSNLECDDHEEKLRAEEFYRYGYVEYLFFKTFMKSLLELNIITEEQHQNESETFYSPEQQPNGEIVAPCSNIPFFSTLLKTLLAHPLQNEQHSSPLAMTI